MNSKEQNLVYVDFWNASKDLEELETWVRIKTI